MAPTHRTAHRPVAAPRAQPQAAVDARADQAVAAQPTNVAAVERAAAAAGVPRELGLGVAFHESRFDTNAGSPTGVRGVMQLTQRTARGMGLNRDNNDQNIQGGMQVLRSAIDRCHSTTDYACLARNYNGSTPAQQAAWAQGVRQAVTHFNATARP